MIIRNQQHLELSERNFTDRVATHLRENHAEYIKEKKDPELTAFIEEKLSVGRGYELTWETTLTGFVVLSLILGARFDEHPRVQRILTNEEIPPNDRLKMLIGGLSNDEWNEIEEFSKEA